MSRLQSPLSNFDPYIDGWELRTEVLYVRIVQLFTEGMGRLWG